MNKTSISASFLFSFFLFSQHTYCSHESGTHQNGTPDNSLLNKKPALVLLLKMPGREDYFGFIFDKTNVSKIKDKSTFLALATENSYSNIQDPELKKAADLIKKHLEKPITGKALKLISSSSRSMWEIGKNSTVTLLSAQPVKMCITTKSFCVDQALFKDF